jgi:hypothetical protein
MSAVNAALETAMETIRAVTSTTDEKASAYSLIDAAIRTHQAWPQLGKCDSPTSGASRPRRSSTAKNESPSVSCTHDDSTLSRHTEEATSSTDLCRPWKTNDSKSTSQQLQKRKQLHTSRQTSLDKLDQTSLASDKPDRPDKAKPKGFTGGRPLPASYKAHKKTKADEEEKRGYPPRRLVHAIFHLHASSGAVKLAAWKNVGASRQFLKWIREGVTIPLLNNRLPPHSTKASPL